jgi:hypothetical protein
LPPKPRSEKLRDMDKVTLIISLILALTVSGSHALAEDTQSQVKTGRVVGPDPNDPVTHCMAYQSMLPVEKKKNGPLKLITKGLASELGTESSNMLKDTIFVFSAKDVDPYDQSPPTNKPYTLLEIRFIDGSSAELIKYPDNSGKVQGGFADGTIICPEGNNSFIVAYPNGVRGKMVKLSSNEYKIYRPDNSVTTIKKTMSGGYEITNDKIGYMGTARPDSLGMQFEFNTTNF